MAKWSTFVETGTEIRPSNYIPTSIKRVVAVRYCSAKSVARAAPRDGGETMHCALTLAMALLVCLPLLCPLLCCCWGMTMTSTALLTQLLCRSPFQLLLLVLLLSELLTGQNGSQQGKARATVLHEAWKYGNSSFLPFFRRILQTNCLPNECKPAGEERCADDINLCLTVTFIQCLCIWMCVCVCLCEWECV